MMKKIYLLVILMLMTGATSYSQSLMRGLYVNSFNSILGTSSRTDEVLNYAQANGFNYIALYSLEASAIDLDNNANPTGLSSFIVDAHSRGMTVGAIGESVSMCTAVIAYNNYGGGRPANERFDVYNLEFEFWNGANYCSTLTPNYTCDNAGAWSYESAVLLPGIRTAIDNYNASSATPMLFEIYLGWPDASQMATIVSYVDRVLLHAYRTTDSDVYGYSDDRIWDAAKAASTGCSRLVTICPIFSSESSFMMSSSWLQTKQITRPFDTYLNGGNQGISTNFMNDAAANFNNKKQYVRIGGYQWFKYSLMPAQIMINGVVVNGTTVTLCTGQTISGNHGAAVSPSQYLWSTGATTQSITPASSGTYTVTVTNALGVSSSASVTVTRVTATAPSVTVSTASAISCFGSTNGSLTASPSGGSPFTYSWNSNPVQTSATATSLKPAHYNITITNTSGCKTYNTTSLVQPYPVTACTSTTPKGCTVNGTMTATNQSGGTGAYSYLWSNSSTSNPASAATAGTYTLTITDANSCTGSFTATVASNTTAPAACAGSAASICAGQSASIGCASVPGNTYSWSPTTALSSSTVSNPTASPVTTTVYTVTETITASGCTASNPVTVTVGADPKGLTYDGSDDQCVVTHNSAYNLGTGAFSIEAHVMFDATNTQSYPMIISKRGAGGGGILFGMWNITGTDKGKLFLQLGGVTPNYIDVSGPSINDGNCHYVAVTRSPTGTVKFYVDGVASSTSTSSTTSITSTNNYWFGLDAGNSANTHLKGSLDWVRIWSSERTSTEINTYLDYCVLPTTNLVGHWQIDATDQNTGTGQTIRDLSSTANNGVRGTTSSSETADPTWATICGHRHAMIPAEDPGVYLTGDSLLRYNAANSFIVYPNPSDGIFNIDLAGRSDVQYVFSDMKGNILMEGLLNSNRLDASRFEQGVYMLTLRTNQGTVIKKLLKE